MSLLTLIQDVCSELRVAGLPESVIGNTDDTIRQLVRLAQREGETLSELAQWAELEREHTFTLTNGTADYNLPADFSEFIYRTQWDRTNHWEMMGPVSAQEWQWRKSGITSNTPRRRFRITGVKNYSAVSTLDTTDTSTNLRYKMTLDPTPGSGDDGDTMVLEYISTNWIFPQQHQSGITFASPGFCSNANYIYKCTSGGVAGATTPVHTSGSASDGTVTWAFWGNPYNKFLADTDFTVLPESLVGLGTQVRFLRANGLNYKELELEYNNLWRQKCTNVRGARTLNMTRQPTQYLLGPGSVPDTGFGS